MDPKLSACCTLAKLAFKGGTTNAYFATSANELRSALSDILFKAVPTTSRAVPVFASSSSTSSSGSFTFLPGLVPVQGSLWHGVLDRQRTFGQKVTQNGVTSLQAVTQDISAQDGDDFAANVNSGDSTHPRHYYTAIGEADTNGKVWSSRSMRPTIA